MLHTLYLLIIAPLEFLMRLVLEWGFSLTHSWGWSLVLLSLAVNTAILPIYNRAEGWQEDERVLKRSMSRHEAMLRRTFSGQKRFFLLSALRRQFGYGCGFTLLASVGLLLQIPFFFAAYHLLSHFSPLSGHSFGFLADLGAPDALLSLGGLTVNVLPLLMTVVNLASAFVYTTGLTPRDRVQICGMALLFLVLLYTASSALTLYWTLNNVYSLGKNIVGKYRMRRSALATAFRSGRRKVSPSTAQVTQGYCWTRIVSSAWCSFGVGVIFWLYICTGISAANPIQDNSYFALLHVFAALAQQCLLTACLSGLALAVVIPLPQVQHRQAMRCLSLAALTVFLFLLQSGVLKYGFVMEHGHCPVDMWNRDGQFCFAVWLAALFILRRFWKRLAGFTRDLCIKLVTCLARITNKTTSSRLTISYTKNSFNTWHTFILAGLMGNMCGFFLCIFIPFCSYFHNINEFDVSSMELFLKVAPYYILTTLFVSLFFFISTFFLPYVFVRVPWKLHTGGKGNISYSFVMSLLFLLWIEGTVLSYGLPLLDGRSNLFTSLPRTFFDFILWIIIPFLGLAFWRHLTRNLLILSYIFILLSCASLIDAFRERDVQIWSGTFTPSRYFSLTSKSEIYQNLYFSSNNNIIILLIDSLDTLSFEKTLDVYPELKQYFDGFYLFRENTGPGGLTHLAIPQILHGKTYDGDRTNYRKFVQESLSGMNSIAGDAQQNGYNVFIDASYWHIMSKNLKGYNSYTQESLPKRLFIHKLLFRFIPYYLKRFFDDEVNFNDIDNINLIKEAMHARVHSKIISDMYKIDVNKAMFDRIIAKTSNINSIPVLQFLYFFGVHHPFVKEDIIKTTESIIQNFANFLHYLQKNGIFNKTTIIIMADHGLYGDDYRFFYPNRNIAQPTSIFPVLMIKTPNSTGELKICNDLMSSIYIRDIINNFYRNGFTNESLDNYLKTLPAIRTYYHPEKKMKFFVKGDSSTLILTLNDKNSE